MPATSVGYVFMMAIFHLLGIEYKGDWACTYDCNSCGNHFRFKTSKEYPKPFCIHCESKDITQTGGLSP